MSNAVPAMMSMKEGAREMTKTKGLSRSGYQLLEKHA
jgi:hypothetical protein